MKFILLAVSLFFATNTYAVILNYLYIYPEDGDGILKEDLSIAKEELRIAKNKLGEANLNSFKENRKVGSGGYDKDEVVYVVGDTSKKDVGAKIGMTTEQIINKTYWGKPDNRYAVIDRNEKIELWTYYIYGDRKGVSHQRTGHLFFVNGKLTHIDDASHNYTKKVKVINSSNDYADSAYAGLR